MTIERLNLNDPDAKSADPVAANIAALKALFPAAVADGRIDFDTLRQLLGDEVDDGDERYGLSWPGKRRARRLALTPSTGTLRPAPEDSVEWDTTRNLMIEGDNLEVLKLLQKSYAGEVKLIYIDPPYNTGNDFIYPDDYADTIGNYLRRSGQVGEGGALNTSNPQSSGRFHTDWLNMMCPRLTAARTLLAPDGIIAISIDENELSNVLTICDEVYGEECLIGVVAVQLNPRGRHLDRFIARTHEYICLYARDPDNNPTLRIAKDERMTAEYRKQDARGLYRELELRNRNPAFNRTTRPNLFYPIYVDPTTGSVSVTRDADHSIEVFPKNSEGGDSCWTWGRDKLARDRGIVLGRVVSDGGYRIYRKDYLFDEDGEGATTLPKGLWLDKAINNDIGKKRIQELFGESVFSFPKSPDLINRIVDVAAPPGSLVLDFFAGSGTTGDALFQKNADDGGGRRFILVQLPEPLDAEDKEQKSAATFCDQLGKPQTIAELTKERLRRAASKVKADHPDTQADLGFRVYKLATSSLRAWEPSDDLAADLLAAADNIVQGRSEEDLLTELLLKRGLDLTEPMLTETIAGLPIHAMGGGVLVVCLAPVTAVGAEAVANGIADWIERLQPTSPSDVFFKDTGFEDDVAKANVAAILEQRLEKQLLKVRSL
ncbi:site-specific DNA-methyltransferase [Sphingomonas sp.]|uniref:site-specific DNA-methyltransferase n=1 Tax=Sphingomonas sp. TaxID=28214 RepID=UPI003B00CEC8